MQELKEAIKNASKNLFGVDIKPELTRPEEQFGDYSTNIALQLAGKLNKSPRQIAKQLAESVKHPAIEKAEVAGAGFINFTLTDKALSKATENVQKLPKQNSGKEILAEFGDPNPFKEMHVGHLYSAVIGDSIAGILEASGANVRRLSYHGDVGLHVARAIWAMRQETGKLKDDLGEYYAKGAKAYEQDKQAASQVREVNKHIYAKDDTEINRLHDEGVKHSFKYFDQIFSELGIKYSPNGRYLESEAMEAGLAMVKENIDKVFEKSEGAVVYKGEKVGLHTRVFLNSEGLPTYETKDLGLTKLKNKDYPNASQSLIITAHEQAEYFKVMLAALKEINPEVATKTVHIAHGFVSLTTGKMSSRTGDVFAAKTLLDNVRAEVKKRYPDSESTDKTYIAAVKYSLLKQRLGADVIFDVEESVSLEGNSGPYLQYAHARARAILEKSKVESQESKVGVFEPGERNLARKVSEYPEVIEKAVVELMPHHICTYLYELAQVFNRFYENNRVVGNPREAQRIKLVQSYAHVLKNGLEILNIPAPGKM
ncbi:arginine--tRNA ligase [Candidatus Saccharibacteria bacterium]|nr:arginine--tRNA ligase [Candidatus Saccharibacteria bacterium]